MKNIFNKVKTYLVAIVCLILILAGYGGKTVYDENIAIGESQAVIQELPEVSEVQNAVQELPETSEVQNAVQELPETSEVQDATQKLPEATKEQTVQGQESSVTQESQPVVQEQSIDSDGIYTTVEDVALYLHIYGELPQNFMTKKEAQALGWPGGSLEEYAPGMCIGGDYFGNYEGMLPKEKGRKYYECDIDTLGADSRGPKRIVYSNDGLIYYTQDHYDSFELLYGEE